MQKISTRSAMISITYYFHQPLHSHLDKPFFILPINNKPSKFRLQLHTHLHGSPTEVNGGLLLSRHLGLPQHSDILPFTGTPPPLAPTPPLSLSAKKAILRYSFPPVLSNHCSYIVWFTKQLRQNPQAQTDTASWSHQLVSMECYFK